MSLDALKTPVALFVFRRPDTTQQVFDRIAQARPARLLLVADGPRQGKADEADACRKVLEIVSRVDWPCEVSQNFSDRNLGCGERMISGLNWVFSLVEEAIILEDDCLPDISFFRFCEELLEKYRGDSRVGSICGTNLVARNSHIAESYYFSRLGSIWGWATWSSAWQRYDRYLDAWPRLRDGGMLAEIFEQPKDVAYWTNVFDAMHGRTGPDTWDYQWLFTHLKNNASAILPAVNLVANIGFGTGATHTGSMDERLTPPVSAIEFPLRHPASFVPSRSMDRHLQLLFLRPLGQRILGRLQRLTNRVQR